ncbi:MAG: glycosyltransferase 87 family protein [Phycisphaerae bacterium]
MKQARASEIRPLVTCALLMEATFLSLHFARAPAEQVALVLLSYLVSGLAFGWLLWRLRSGEAYTSSRWTIPVIVAGAVIFRLTLLPLPPAASQDVQRYLWEGLARLRGFCPYTLAPSAKELAPLAAEYPAVWRSINHPDLAAVYPPFAQSLFLCNAAVFGGSLLGWKVILLVFDGLLAAGLWLLLKGRSLAMIGLAGVLWCPLLLLETYEGGHLDLIGAALMVLAIVALDRGRAILSGLALGLCINVKYLWPLLLLIVLARQAARQRRGVVLVTVAAAVAVAVWVPYRSGFESAVATAKVFAESWTFNDVIFEVLRGLPGPRWVPMAFVLGCLASLAALLALRRPRDIWLDAWLLMGAALLFSPVAYPWYFLWIVPGLAMRPPTWLVVWVLSVPALHLVDWQYVSTGRWDPMPWLWTRVGVIPAVLLIRAWWQRLGRRDRGGLPPTALARQQLR